MHNQLSSLKVTRYGQQKGDSMMCLWMTIVWVTINDLAYHATTGHRSKVRDPHVLS
jgi:hypothetical protein